MYRARDNNCQNIQKMFEIMSVHYTKLKDQVGLRDVFDSSQSDEETEKIFHKLRPQSPYKFKELIKNDFDPKKFNRMLGKADARMSQQQVKDVILYDKPIEHKKKMKLEKEEFASL